jgi:7,8-dihydroneopterin aldolase/epimerase/oxygenase
VKPPPKPASASATSHIAGVKVFVRGLKLEAEIGVHDHEYGRTQPLIAEIELDVAIPGWDRLSDIFNYETIVAKAKAVAAEGHFQLVERFAGHLARACMEDARVKRARVRVEKPMALAPVAETAGAEIILERD